MITAEDLLAAGYKKFQHYETYTGSEGYQKVITHSNAQTVKLYFLNAFIWQCLDRTPRIEFDVRLYLVEGNTLCGSNGITLKVHCVEATTISEVEAFYAKVYRDLDCAPDANNND